MREKGEGSKEGKTIVLGCFLEGSSGGTVSSIQPRYLEKHRNASRNSPWRVTFIESHPPLVEGYPEGLNSVSPQCWTGE